MALEPKLCDRAHCSWPSKSLLTSAGNSRCRSHGPSRARGPHPMHLNEQSHVVLWVLSRVFRVSLRSIRRRTKVRQQEPELLLPNGISTRCLLKEGWPLRRQAQSTVLTGTMVLLMKMHEVGSPSSWGGNSNPVLTGSSVSRGLTVCLPFTLLLGSQDARHPPAVVRDIVVQDAAVWDAVAWDVVVRDVVGWDAVVLDAAVRDAVVWDVVVWDAVIGTLQYGMLWFGMLWSWMLQFEILWSGTHSSQLLLQWISFLWLPWNILNEQKSLDSLNKPKQNTIS